MHPSGEQVEIGTVSSARVVVEVGGGPCCYDVDGHAVLDGYGVDAMVTGVRGQPLIRSSRRPAGPAAR